MEEQEYFDRYEEHLTEAITEYCTGAGEMNGRMLEVTELDELWQRIAPEYMADAVSQINAYPAVSMAWAGYAGMAAAMLWDKDWDNNASVEYGTLKGPDGFDLMDEHITRDILGLELDSEPAKKIETTLRNCAHTAMSLIRHEEIESQSTKAFYIFARTVKVMFRTGVSLQLKRLGYHYEKVQINMKN